MMRQAQQARAGARTSGQSSQSSRLAAAAAPPPPRRRATTAAAAPLAAALGSMRRRPSPASPQKQQQPQQQRGLSSSTCRATGGSGGGGGGGGRGPSSSPASSTTNLFSPVYVAIFAGYAALLLLHNPYIYAVLTIAAVLPQNSAVTSLNNLVLLFYESGLFANFAEAVYCVRLVTWLSVGFMLGSFALFS